MDWTAFGLSLKLAFWTALLLLAMHARHWTDALEPAGLTGALAQVLLVAVPLAGGLMLVALGSRSWLAALGSSRNSVATEPARP